jgi:hypothetical protein
VKTAAFSAAAVLVLLDAVASFRVGGSEVLSRRQKIAWLLAVWLAPLIGAILALNVCGEVSVPAPVPGSPAEAPNPGIEPEKTGYL